MIFNFQSQVVTDKFAECPERAASVLSVFARHHCRHERLELKAAEILVSRKCSPSATVTILAALTRLQRDNLTNVNAVLSTCTKVLAKNGMQELSPLSCSQLAHLLSICRYGNDDRFLETLANTIASFPAVVRHQVENVEKNVVDNKKYEEDQRYALFRFCVIFSLQASSGNLEGQL